MAFQFGITTFFWSDFKQKYVGRPFNFALFPKSSLEERTFSANSDTLGFLTRFHFDFNSVFRQGISYA
jgi:hypothetical protein